MTIDFEDEAPAGDDGESNPYLRHEAKALQLIARVYSGPDLENPKRRRFEELQGRITNYLLPALGRIPLAGLNMTAKMRALAAKLSEQIYFPHLAGKTIIGVGGKFSAGKSCFLNKLTGCENQLPVDQEPTTALPTYLVAGEKPGAYACTSSGRLREVDDQELEALTHAFHAKYSIGFVKEIRKMLIFVPGFHQANLALLDTPGYSNPKNLPDNPAGGEDLLEAVLHSQDARLARQHLQNSDYLLWLVDSDDGGIHETDIRFLRSLNLQKPFLAVLTKADKKEESKLREIMEHSQKTLERAKLPIFGLTAFSALTGEYFGKRLIEDFLKKSSADSSGREDILGRFRDDLADWETLFQRHKKHIEDEEKNLTDQIQATWDPFVTTTLVALYKEYQKQGTQLFYTEKKVRHLKDEIREEIKKLLREGP